MSKSKSPNKKIIIAAGVFPPDIGGPAEYAKLLAEESANSGYSVDVVCFGGERPGAKYRVHTIGRGAPSLFRYIKFWSTLKKLATGGTLMYTFDLASTGLPCAILKKLKPETKLVVRLGGDFQYEQALRKGLFLGSLQDYYSRRKFNIWENMVYAVTNFVLRKCDAVVFNSRYVRDMYEAYHDLDKERSRIIKNIRPVRRDITARRMSKKRVRFLFMGRFVAVRNLPNLIEVFSQATEGWDDVELKLIGRGPDESAMRKKIEDLGSAGRIMMFGPVSHNDMAVEIAKSDVLVLPSLTEINSNFIAEGLVQNKIIIHTQESEIGRLAHGLKGIFLVDPVINHDLFDAIRGAARYARARPEVDNSICLERVTAARDDIFEQNVKLIEEL